MKLLILFLLIGCGKDLKRNEQGEKVYKSCSRMSYNNGCTNVKETSRRLLQIDLRGKICHEEYVQCLESWPNLPNREKDAFRSEAI